MEVSVKGRVTVLYYLNDLERKIFKGREFAYPIEGRMGSKEFKTGSPKENH